MNMSTRKAGSTCLTFAEFHQRTDGTWGVLFEGPGEAHLVGRASSPRLALYAALDALETRASGLDRARAELERVEAELHQALGRCA